MSSIISLPTFTYNIPKDFTDESGNFISNTVMVTINSIHEGAIPFGNYFLIFIGVHNWNAFPNLGRSAVSK